MTQTDTQKTYTNAKEAFEDLKEAFLNIAYRPLVHKQQQVPGLGNAKAIQYLQGLDEEKLLEFANQDIDLLTKMIIAARNQDALNHEYRQAEPEFPGSAVECFEANQRALRYNNFLLSDAPASYIVEYNRAFQKMYEHIESKFKRPLVNIDQVERRQEMIWGLAMADHQQLIDLMGVDKDKDKQLMSHVIKPKTDDKEYMDSIADTCALIARETRGEYMEQQALGHRSAAIGAGAAAVTAAIATPVVQHYTDKEHSSTVGIAGTVSFGIFAAIAATQLFKHAKKFGESMQQYASVTNRILSNDKVHSHYYKLKKPKELYQDFSL